MQREEKAGEKKDGRDGTGRGAKGALRLVSVPRAVHGVGLAADRRRRVDGELGDGLARAVAAAVAGAGGAGAGHAGVAVGAAAEAGLAVADAPVGALGVVVGGVGGGGGVDPGVAVGAGACVFLREGGLLRWWWLSKSQIFSLIICICCSCLSR